MNRRAFGTTTPGKVVYALVPLSLSSIICYWQTGGDALEGNRIHTYIHIYSFIKKLSAAT